MVGLGGGSRWPFCSPLLHKAWNPVVELLHSLAVSAPAFCPFFFCPKRNPGDEKRRKVETEIMRSRTVSTWTTAHKSTKQQDCSQVMLSKLRSLGRVSFISFY